MAAGEQDSNAVFDQLLKLDVTRCAVHVCVASCIGDDDIPEFQRLQLATELTAEFRNVIVGAFQRWRKEKEAYQLVLWPHLDGTRPEPHEFEYLDLDMHDSIRVQLEGLARPIIDLPLFEADDEIVSGIRFYVIIAQPADDEPVYFFRTYTPKRELSRSKWFAGWLRGGQFDKVDTPTFLFDDRIDCFCVGKHMFVVQKTNFQAIFRFFEMVARAATATLSIIQSRISIKNFKEFAEDCQGHLQKLAKLKNIAQQPYLSTISMSDIRAVIDLAQLKNIPIEKVNGVEMLVYDRKDRWALLRLLDNHYMQSLLTKGFFDATDKRPLVVERKRR